MSRKNNFQNNNFWSSLKQNNMSFGNYYKRLTEMSLSLFEYEKLPDTVDERFMELALFGDGCCVFFKDDVLGFLCLQTTLGGPLNVYRIPVDRIAYASNGYHMALNDKNSVIIWNNYTRTPSFPTVIEFANRLEELDRTIDINVKSQKTPLLLLCDENERLSIKNLYMKYDGNSPVICGNKKLNPDSIRAINTGAPFIAQSLYNLKQEIWNEALTYIGIPSGKEKKERLIVDEVVREQGGTISMLQNKLAMREKACNEINKMFGLDIKVRARFDIGEQIHNSSTVDM